MESQEDDMFYHELCSKEWEQPFDGFLFPNSDNELSKLHKSLLTYNNTNPVVNICNQLPSVLVQDLRILDLGATWRSRGGLINVLDIWEDVIGTMEEFELVFTGANDDGMITTGQWNITEYVSTYCQDGTSAIVIMTCKDPNWNTSELAVKEAEENIFRFNDDSAKRGYRSPIESGIHKVALGKSISTLMAVRKQIKEVEERNTSLKGSCGPPSFENHDLLAAGGTD